ncbi:MAG TPA: hypothetical protein VNO14_11470, partial [Blastocatellia bacterium]|nr:hypothetical protein [Blastocatellia bacterium]
VMEDGVTGFIVDGMDEAVRAVEKLSTLDRRRCRAVFDERFTAARMASEYLNIYQRIIESEIAPALHMPARPGAAAAHAATGSASVAD